MTERRMWTTKEEEALKQFCKFAKFGYDEIGRILNRSKQSVEMKAHKMNFQKKYKFISDAQKENMSTSHIGLKASSETCIKIRESHLGENNPFFGKSHTEEYKKEQSKRSIILGIKNGKKHSQFMKNLWQNREYRNEQLKKIFNGLQATPNKPEQILIDIITKHNLSYKYTGNGEFVLGGKCPDFINTNGKKEVIEVFGRAFHSPLFTFRKNMPYHQTYEGTIEHYKKYGFTCRIFWDIDVMREDVEQFILTQLGVKNAR